MNFETLKYEKKDSIGVLTLSRPEALNALNQQMIQELTDWVSEVKQDNELRVVVVTGEGKSFVSGADIKEMKDHSQNEALEMSRKGQQLFQSIEDLKVPVIAGVNGYALGGGLELALACDFIVASEKAKLGLPEVGLGLIPGYGGTQRLSRFVGKNVARMMALTGDIFTVQEALQWGVVVRVVKPEDLMTSCLQIAEKMASQSPKAISLAKRAINEGYDCPQLEGMKVEAQLFSETFKTEDHIEGINAFLGKRKPQFKGI